MQKTIFWDVIHMKKVFLIYPTSNLECVSMGIPNQEMVISQFLVVSWMVCVGNDCANCYSQH